MSYELCYSLAHFSFLSEPDICEMWKLSLKIVFLSVCKEIQWYYKYLLALPLFDVNTEEGCW